MRYLLGRAEPADRNLRQLTATLVVRQLLRHHWGHDVSWRDRVGGDSVARRLPRGRERETDKRTLRYRVGCAGGETAAFGGVGRHVDDPSPFPSSHAGQEGADQQEGSLKIYQAHPAPFLKRRVVNLVVGQDPCVVDQNVDRTKRLDEL